MQAWYFSTNSSHSATPIFSLPAVRVPDFAVFVEFDCCRPVLLERWRLQAAKKTSNNAAASAGKTVLFFESIWLLVSRKSNEKKRSEASYLMPRKLCWAEERLPGAAVSLKRGSLLG